MSQLEDDIAALGGSVSVRVEVSTRRYPAHASGSTQLHIEIPGGGVAAMDGPPITDSKERTERIAVALLHRIAQTGAYAPETRML